MWKLFAGIVLVVVFAGEHAEAADCCSAYTDVFGKYHSTFLCDDYCCLNPSLGKLKACCNDIIWRVSSDARNEECFKSWVEEHIWVPIVGGIISLVILIALCTCCCCCCSCCRRNPAPVVIHSPGGPQATVTMQQQQSVSSNPVHYGYNQ